MKINHIFVSFDVWRHCALHLDYVGFHFYGLLKNFAVYYFNIKLFFVCVYLGYLTCLFFSYVFLIVCR